MEFYTRLAFGNKTTLSDEAADRLVGCYLTCFGIKTDTEKFLTVLQRLVELGRGSRAQLIYYRLLHALELPLPPPPAAETEGSVLALERDLLMLPKSEYHRVRTIAHRNRSRQESYQSISGSGPWDIRPGVTILKPADLIELLWIHLDDEELLQKHGIITWLAATGSIELLDAILKRHPGLASQKNGEGISPIMAASRNGQLAAVRCLTERGTLNLCDLCGETPMHYLIMFDKEDVEAACTLLQNAGCNIDSFVLYQDRTFSQEWREINLFGSPLQWAIAYDREDIVRVLLSNGANINYDGGLVFWSPIHCAVYHHSAKILRLLFSDNHCRKDLRFSPFRKLASRVPFHRILALGQQRRHALEETVRELLEQGYDIHDRFEIGPSGGNIEHWIMERILKDDSFHAEFSTVEVLVANGAPMNRDPISVASCLGYQHPGPQGRLATFLWKNGFVSSPTTLGEPHILHTLAYGGLTDAAEGLLEAGAPVDPLYNTPRLGLVTPLIIAVFHNPNFELVEILLGHGANVNHRCGCEEPNVWDTPLGMCLGRGSCDGRTVDLLLDCGAETAFNGLSIIHHAIGFSSHVGDRHIANYLLRRDEHNRPRHPRLAAYINMDCNGLVPIVEAVRRLNTEAIYALLNAGVRVKDSMLVVLNLLSSHAVESQFPRDFDFERWDRPEQVQDLVVELLNRISSVLEGEGLALGCSSLHWAAEIGSYRNVRRLVEKGANVMAKNIIGLFPLDVVLPRTPRGREWKPEQLTHLGQEKKKISLYLIEKMLSTSSGTVADITPEAASELRSLGDKIGNEPSLFIAQSDEDDALKLDLALYSTALHNWASAPQRDDQTHNAEQLQDRDRNILLETVGLRLRRERISTSEILLSRGDIASNQQAQHKRKGLGLWKGLIAKARGRKGVEKKTGN